MYVGYVDAGYASFDGEILRKMTDEIECRHGLALRQL
jgi:hypothetical protein